MVKSVLEGIGATVVITLEQHPLPIENRVLSYGSNILHLSLLEGIVNVSDHIIDETGKNYI